MTGTKRSTTDATAGAKKHRAGVVWGDLSLSCNSIKFCVKHLTRDEKADYDRRRDGERWDFDLEDQPSYLPSKQSLTSWTDWDHVDFVQLEWGSGKTKVLQDESLPTDDAVLAEQPLPDDYSGFSLLCTRCEEETGCRVAFHPEVECDPESIEDPYRTNGDEEIAWEVGSGRLLDDAVLYDLRHLVG